MLRFMDVLTRRPRSKLISVILCTLSASCSLTLPIAHADGIGMAELCNRPHRDLISIYVQGALESAERDATTIMSELEKALESGSLEVTGLKSSWKLVMPYCLPQRFKADQAADILCDFLTLNPQKRRRESIALLNEALQRAWPCPDRHKE
ncbi:Rap1a/Tai family immunity protein [Tardiphaga sp. OK245]|uniref:Rap1a/Tai family immunity protein n=1 Tax=Tardiphaga sp. OK245 TaxID=1855306 RepID=UPI0008A812C6|nr:Rap1a/Tai family immunity protein [Tardiphaga sp. OK245]SEI19591.1 hypothetical protein SAMN05216367_4911 [Tardiphaga sp. OK245]